MSVVTSMVPETSAGNPSNTLHSYNSGSGSAVTTMNIGQRREYGEENGAVRTVAVADEYTFMSCGATV